LDTLNGTHYNVAGGHVFQIAFTSKNVNPAQGFSLKFEGIGNDGPPPGYIKSYKLFEQAGAETGLITYPDPMDPVPEDYSFILFTVHPSPGNRNKGVALTVNLTSNGYYPNGCSTLHNTLILNEVGPGVTYPSTRFRYRSYQYWSHMRI